jgi:hypothetical protein
VLGLFDGDELAEHGGSRPSGAHAATSSASLSSSSTRDVVDGICLVDGAALVRSYEELARVCRAPTARLGRASRPGSRSATTTRARSGPDRIANAVAAARALRRAVHRRRLRHVDQLRRRLAQAEYVGGVLAPGIEVSMDALFAARRGSEDRLRRAAARDRKTTSMRSSQGSCTASPARSTASSSDPRRARGPMRRRSRRAASAELIAAARAHDRARRPVPDARGPAPDLGRGTRPPTNAGVVDERDARPGAAMVRPQADGARRRTARRLALSCRRFTGGCELSLHGLAGRERERGRRSVRSRDTALAVPSAVRYPHAMFEGCCARSTPPPDGCGRRARTVPSRTARCCGTLNAPYDRRAWSRP